MKSSQSSEDLGSRAILVEHVLYSQCCCARDILECFIFLLKFHTDKDFILWDLAPPQTAKSTNTCFHDSGTPEFN